MHKPYGSWGGGKSLRGNFPGLPQRVARGWLPQGGIPLVLAWTVTEGAGVALYPAENRVVPDPWV